MTHSSTADSDPHFLRIGDISKDYSGVVAVSKLDLDITRGELFCLLGSSGSGKSTLLRVIAGLEKPDTGCIEIEGQDVTGFPPWRRPVSMMFQSYALFPHMNVARNIGYGLRQDGWAESDAVGRIGEMLNLVQLEGFEDRKPYELSGGQRQRVALARAIARKPKVLLLDEPLSALDKKLREETQQQLLAIQREIGTTFIMVTHDQDEALSIATRIGVMEKGRLVQVGSPREIYERPVNRQVASFIGQVNLFAGTVSGTGSESWISNPDFIGKLSPAAPMDLAHGQKVWLAVRPERMVLNREEGRGASTTANRAMGILQDIVYLGGRIHLAVELKSGQLVRIMVSGDKSEYETDLQIGDQVHVSFDRRSAVLLEE